MASDPAQRTDVTLLSSPENPSVKAQKKSSVFGDQDAGVRTMGNIEEVDMVNPFSFHSHASSVFHNIEKKQLTMNFFSTGGEAGS
jgi:hypothetical protein